MQLISVHLFLYLITAELLFLTDFFSWFLGGSKYKIVICKHNFISFIWFVLEYRITVGFCISSLLCRSKILVYLICWVTFVKACRIMVNDFSASIEMTCYFFILHSVNVMYHSYCFVYVEPSLHARSKSHSLGMWSFYCDTEFTY